MNGNGSPARTTSPRYIGVKDLIAMAAVAVVAITLMLAFRGPRANANLHCPPGTHDMSGLPAQPGSTVQCGDTISVTVGSKP